jgi:hypothetical protein
MSEQKDVPIQPPPNRIPTAIILALIPAVCALVGTIIEVIANPDWFILLQKNQTPAVILTVTETEITPIFSPQPTLTRAPTAPSESTSAFLAECPEVEIYFKLNLSTDTDQTKCPNQQNVIELGYADIQGLSALSGQAVGSALTSDSTCFWNWHTDENITLQDFSSPKGDCSFSIGLTKDVKKIYLQLISDPNRPFFTINLNR